MRLTPFKIGILLVILGIVWVAIIFDETEKEHDAFLLKESNSAQIKLEFRGTDIGYYKLYMPEFTGEEMFVQILDVKDNVIQEQMIQTKMSVGYFDFDEDGKYTLKVTNIAKNSVDMQIEFGNTNSQKMQFPGIMIFVGAIVIMIMSYLKIKNYNIEQPEENIS